MKKPQISRFKALFFALWAITPLLLFGCTCGKFLQNNDILHTARQTDSVRNERNTDRRTYARDSVYVRDSICILVRGDTIFRDRWRTKYVNKAYAVTYTDTLIRYVYKFSTDTLRVKQTEYKYVDKPLTMWQQVRMMIGNIAIIFIIVLFVGIIGKLFDHK